MNTTKQIKTNILIVGAGPAGSVLSMFLSKKKIHHILIDKENFPRDKVCGDAISGKVLHILNRINPDFVKEMVNDSEHFNPCNGVIFNSPGGETVQFPFQRIDSEIPSGFICKRNYFDNFLLRKSDTTYCNFINPATAESIRYTGSGIEITIRHKEEMIIILCKIVVGADGVNSILSSRLAQNKLNRKHHCASVRTYYSDVHLPVEKGYMELFFFPELLPGYFWIFPLNDKEVNVGIGSSTKNISQNKISLPTHLKQCITDNKLIKDRFTSAIQTAPLKGWSLPLGSLKRKLSGHRFILIGDAAGLVEPFLGEGIGNAMLSAEIAVEHLALCLERDRWDESINLLYQQNIYNTLQKEFRISTTIQKLSQWKGLFDYVVRKAGSSPKVKDLISRMFSDVSLRENFNNPLFYLGLFFK